MLNVLATEGPKFDQEYNTSDLCAKNNKELTEAAEVTGEPLSIGHT